VLQRMDAQRDETRKVHDDLMAMRQENAALKRQVDGIRQASRRQTTQWALEGPATPIRSPAPAVSAITNAAFSQLHTPGTQASRAGARASVGGVDRLSFGGGDDAVVEEDVEEKDDAGQEVDAPEQDRSEAAKLAKIMSKQPAPAKFSGEKEQDKEKVEEWVRQANSYLKGQFGVLKRDHPEERLIMIRSYMEGAAAKWMDDAIASMKEPTWEALQVPFIQFVGGGRETKQLRLEKMAELTYKKGKCKDLLSLEQEFETLRVKLYPTSSIDPAMNEEVGRKYADAIKRGDPALYAEMLRIVGVGNEPIPLSTWKAAAVRARSIADLTRTSHRSTFYGRGGGGDSGGGSSSSSGSRLGSSAVHEMDTAGGFDSEDDRDRLDEAAAEGREGQPGAAVQQVQGRRAGSRRPRTRRPGGGPFFLPTDVYEKVRARRLCLQCYRPGHIMGDAACKDKDKPRRMPTEAELGNA